MIGAVIGLLQRAKLSRQRTQVQVDPSTRLLRRFGVSFLVPPEQRSYVRVGARGMLNAHIIFESSSGLVEIGERAYIGANTTIISRNAVRIGNDVTMAWDITIYDHNSHSFDWRQRAKVVAHFRDHYGTADCFRNIDWTGVASAPITIQDRAWIGFGAVILKGVTIGEGAIVGACSVVARDVEPYTVVAGNPAREIRRLERQA
jgi:acetyltransferase-like isoleucine patch superfamily enzyme